MNGYFLLQTSNNCKFKFFFHCVNPTGTLFKQQSQLSDTQIESMSKTTPIIYIIYEFSRLVNWYVMSYNVWNLPYNEISSSSSYCRYHNQK